MSSTSDTYSCDVCTFIQSIKRPTCEMCNSPNPNFQNSVNQSGAAAAAAMFDFPINDGVVECYRCNYINIGSNIQICEGCNKSPYDMTGLYSNFPVDFDNESAREESDDDQSNYNTSNNVTTAEDTKESQKTDPPRKVATAIEKSMDNNKLVPYFNRYLLLLIDQKQQKKSFTEDYLQDCLTELFQSLEYTDDKSDGQLTFSACQICCDENEPMVTMKACGHRVVCITDFNRYLSVRIHDGDILPWIPCPAESCLIPCHVENIIQDGRLTYSELLSFLTEYMLKKLSRNENFITCIKCEKGGFLQIGPPKKQQVTCRICHEVQTIEKGVDGDLDPAFKKMIESGDLRECPTCRHLTLKEKGICNVIHCSKCGIWWNWRTREQGHSGHDLKQRARLNRTLWEPGELRYQQELEARNPKEFKALLERNGIEYDPNYIRGGWNN